ncbi:MAG TPA: biotin transporter BioY [Chondromyces sp.]|nr:biotin transporter BioY [Chondromyces sp.]
MNTKRMVYVALFAAIMAVLGFMPPIPLSITPVPITLQTLGVMLAGGILGARLGAMSQLVFLLAVAAGAPLLSGGRGGLSVFVGPSAGYLIGWIAGAFVIGLLIERMKNPSFMKVLLVNVVGGIGVIYLFGIPVQSMLTNIGLAETALSSLVFLPGDITKVVIAAALVPKLRTSLKSAVASYSAIGTR